MKQYEHALQVTRDELAHMEKVAVYFVQAEWSKEIKIGFSTQVGSRISILRSVHFQNMTLLGWIPGGPRVEREMHAKFARWAVGGEWFTPALELLTFIEESTRHDETPQVASIYGRITDWGYDSLLRDEQLYRDLLESS